MLKPILKYLRIGQHLQAWNWFTFFPEGSFVNSILSSFCCLFPRGSLENIYFEHIMCGKLRLTEANKNGSGDWVVGDKIKLPTVCALFLTL